MVTSTAPKFRGHMESIAMKAVQLSCAVVVAGIAGVFSSSQGIAQQVNGVLGSPGALMWVNNELPANARDYNWVECTQPCLVIRLSSRSILTMDASLRTRSEASNYKHPTDSERNQ